MSLTSDPPKSPDVLAARLGAQLLSRPDATSPLEVVERILAMQSQDPRGMRLGVRARSTGLTVADVDRALDAGELVVSWLNRGTLHLVRAVDYWPLFALTTPQLHTGNARRLRQEGVTAQQADHGVDLVVEALAAGPRTRAELREVLDAAGIPTAGQALVHVLFAAALRGLLVRGPVRQGEQAYVAPTDWFGAAPELDPETLPSWLARRFLAGHGPAAPADLARWANVSLGTARRGFAGLGDEVGHRPDGLVDLVDRIGVAAPPWPAPRLLGAFDAVLFGWVDRSPVVGRHAAEIAVGGIFRPIALVDGRAVATWTRPSRRVALRYLEDVGAEVREELDRDAAAVEAFLRGDPTGV